MNTEFDSMSRKQKAGKNKLGKFSYALTTCLLACLFKLIAKQELMPTLFIYDVIKLFFIKKGWPKIITSFNYNLLLLLFF